MKNYYTSAHLIKVKRKGGDAWQGVLRHQQPNPNYVPDPREPMQQRKNLGRKPNPNYVPDPREPSQRNKHITKDVRKTFPPDLVKTKTQANAALTAWHAQKEQEHATPDASMCVSDYVEQYIASRERMGTITPSTSRDYRGVSRYLKYGGDRAIAHIALRDLTPRDVELWEGALLAKGLSGTTTLKAHRLIKLVCRYAFEIGDVPVTPVRGFKAPSLSVGKPNALDAEGRKKLMIELAQMEPEPVTIAAYLALYLGLRRGEICALTWGNVDLEGVHWQDANEQGAKIRISQAFGMAKGGQYLKEPKTASGRRVVSITGGLRDVLEEYRKRKWAQWCDAMQRLEIVPTRAAFDQLFVIGHLDGTPYNIDLLSHHWIELAKRLKLKGTEGKRVTLHDLRHTFATSAVTRGGDVASVSANLGHAQVSTTLNMYTSRDTAAQRETNALVASDLDNAQAGKVLPFNRQATGTEG
ncbi:MAG: site-specific integrase [Atopobiaceae bacterium]|nr:site-specific integrase [Atopobiaceae bacterium]